MSQISFMVFVYGTLKRSQPNAHVFLNKVHGKSLFIGSGRTVQRFPLVIASSYNIPFCLNQPNTGFRINGEVYSVDHTMLKFLDDFEGHPDLYTRQEQQIELDSGISVKASIYLLNRWKSSFLEDASEFLSDYDSFGEHKRIYVDRIPCKEFVIEKHDFGRVRHWLIGEEVLEIAVA